MNIVGIGVDVEPIESFRARPLSKRRAFYERVFSPSEISYCSKFRESAPHFAVRFCAKEAVVKASRSVVDMNISDIYIENNADGAPAVFARSKKTKIQNFFKKHRAMVSLSHSDDVAMAFVIVTRNERGK